ncbi:hypothetical protein WME89_21055 [Sorangium sp. So ce321]|uniref:hypothetical protein n=1 Tax=Sorangium sp. So ce321 TaxID=3133300 RepID=UPI003F61CEDF
MEINKKSRPELKAYFVKNALPTVGNFSDLIDAGLNQKDDGLAKSADQPVQIEAATAGDKPAIHLYESFATDEKPAWVLSLRTDGKKGFGVGDGDGNNRLFIDATTGNVGIGTADPGGYKLNVAGNVNVTGTLRSPMWNVTQVLKQKRGPLPVLGTFKSGGGRLILLVSGSGMRSSAGMMEMLIKLDGNQVGSTNVGVNVVNAHQAFVPEWLVLPSVEPGDHTIQLVYSSIPGVSSDTNDFFSVTVLELPF